MRVEDRRRAERMEEGFGGQRLEITWGSNPVVAVVPVRSSTVT